MNQLCRPGANRTALAMFAVASLFSLATARAQPPEEKTPFRPPAVPLVDLRSVFQRLVDGRPPHRRHHPALDAP